MKTGTKAVAAETTRSKVDPDFFAKHTVAELSGKSDYWLEDQGRLTHPMYLKKGGEHYEPIGWDEAFALIAKNLKGLDSPDQAIFYTSGRAKNEAPPFLINCSSVSMARTTCPTARTCVTNRAGRPWVQRSA